MIEDQSADLAARRSSTYWLLSRLVLEPPTSSFMAELRLMFSAPMEGDDAPLALEVRALQKAVDEASESEVACEALRVEHTRLLGGLSKAYGAPPPYESVVLEDKLPGDATVAVSTSYAEVGMANPAPEAGPADHLGTELRFLALLCHRESGAWRAGDAALASGWFERQREFLDDHVLRWVPQHCDRVAAMAENLYYRAVFTLIADACRLDELNVREIEAATTSPELAIR